MTGNNEMIINQATMKEAIQFWLNEVVLKEPAIVSSVATVSPNGSGYDDFCIKLDGQAVTQ